MTINDLDFRQNALKVEKPLKWLFLALYRDYWMIKNFPGKTAVYVSYPYSKEHSCKKAKKSYARFSGKIGNEQTDRLADNKDPNLNWRWEL